MKNKIYSFPRNIFEIDVNRYIEISNAVILQLNEVAIIDYQQDFKTGFKQMTFNGSTIKRHYIYVDEKFNTLFENAVKYSSQLIDYEIKLPSKDIINEAETKLEIAGFFNHDVINCTNNLENLKKRISHYNLLKKNALLHAMHLRKYALELTLTKNAIVHLFDLN